MDEILLKINNILGPYAWPLLAFVLVVFLVILFRQQIKTLFPRVSEIAFESKNKKFRVAFNKIVKEAQAQAKDVKRDVESSRMTPVHEQRIDPGNLTARDIVLEAWGALKQTAYNSCSALQLAMTPATQLNTAVDRLVGAKAMDEYIAAPIKQLHALGQELANNTNFLPTMESAHTYKSLADNLVDWMMLYILSPSQEKSVESGETALRRSTVVGGNPPESNDGIPGMSLVSVKGLLTGKRYTVTKDRFKIGRNEDNDLCVSDDEYISGNHALLSYHDGNVFLTDQNSHNGTYLNGKKIGMPVMVRKGDKIQLGGSVFQVT